MRLSLPQQDVYFEQQIYKEEPIYNIGAKIEIKGTIHKEILNKAYEELINQHDSYRIKIQNFNDNIKQVILDEHHSSLGFQDFSNVENSYLKAQKYMNEEFRRPFDLNSSDLLHKFVLVKVSEKFHYLFSVYHHIITDGWGTSLMFQRLVKNYNEILGSGSIQSEYPYSYKDFVIEDKNYEQSEDYLKDKSYWVSKFSDVPNPLFEKLETTSKNQKSERDELTIKRSIYNQLEALAKENKCSTFHVILGLIYTYFGKTSQNKDFSVGVPVLNRSKSIYKKTVGLFMGVSPLRMKIDGNDSFNNLVQSIRQQLRNDYRYQRFPLGKLINELRIFEEKEKLFNITLSYEKQNYADHFEDTITKVIPLSHGIERVALALYVREFDCEEDVRIDFDYSTAYFKKETIQRMIKHFEMLIKSVLLNPNTILNDHDFLCKEEHNKVITAFNKTKFSYDDEGTILDYFYQEVHKRPNQIAVFDDVKSYTYHELHRKSDQIAFEINKIDGLRKKSPVAVLQNRSSELICTLLGVLKSGRSYIPLDPEFPKERLEYIIQHSQAEIVLGDEEFEKTLTTSTRFISSKKLVTDQSLLLTNDFTIQAKNTAYIIYTSGSTGNPKGVEISHRSLLNFLVSMKQKPGINDSDTLFSVTTQSFDISILEFFLPLIAGAKLFVASSDLLKAPLEVIQRLEQIKPSIIQSTPSFYQMLFNTGWQGEKSIKALCGGDLLNASLNKKMLEGFGEVWNMYGPTETTIWSTINKMEKPEDAIYIGKPINNTQIYILDEHLKPVPIGVSGNLFIAGDGLATGYWRNQELTDEKFINCPYNTNTKMYDTGDIGKWTSNGELIFLGRKDFQVKIRGYRIELGDVETQLNKIQGIKNSVVIAKKQNNQENILVAYITGQSASLNDITLRAELRALLPWYMIPNTFQVLEEFPVTPNKKIDRKQLMAMPLPSLESGINIPITPSNELEKNILGFYREVLGLDEIKGVDTNFFTLGGHSLSAVKLIGLISEKYRKNLTLKDIFLNPTVRSLASYLQKRNQCSEQITAVERQLNYSISDAQRNIWLSSQDSKTSIAYNMFASYKVTGTLDLQVLEMTMKDLISKFEVLRTTFKEHNGQVFQQIKPISDTTFAIDKNNIKSLNPNIVIQDYVHQEFDLEKDSLIRLGYFESEQGIFLVLVTHHIIMDGWSVENLIIELKKSFNGLTGSMTELNFQFKDFVVWEKKQIEKNQVVNNQFWKGYLGDYMWERLIPLDYEIVKGEPQRGELHCFSLGKNISTSLMENLKTQGGSLYAKLITAIALVIQKEYDRNDICLGTVNSGRSNANLNDHMGMFVKTLPVRLQLKESAQVEEIYEKVQEDLLKLDGYQDIPNDLMRMIEWEVLISIQNQSFDQQNIVLTDSVSLNKIETMTRYSRVPLLFNFIISEGEIICELNYNSSKFDETTILVLESKLKKILEQIAQDDQVCLKAIDASIYKKNTADLDIVFNF